MTADEFTIFLVGGLVIIAVMLAVFGFSFGGYTTSMSFAGLGSPVFVGTSEVEDVQTLYARFDANNFLETNVYDMGARKITSGLLFGSSSIKTDLGKAQSVFVSFDVTSTNGYGPVLIKLDGSVAASTRLDIGHYEFSLGPAQTVEIEAGSSEWRIWAPTVYELDNVKITANSYPYDISTYTFELQDPQKIDSARVYFNLDSNEGAITMKLNGNIVYDGAVNNQQTIFIDSSKFDDMNILTFDAHQDSKFSGLATIALTRKISAEKNLRVDINLTQDEYNKFNGGQILFDVVDVFRPGGYSVKINNNGVQLLNEYVKLEKGFFELNLKKENLKPGLNVLIIEPLDGAAFNVQSLTARL